MIRPAHPSTTVRGGQTPYNFRNLSMSRPFPPSQPNCWPNFPPDFRRHRPPETVPPPNFVIELRSPPTAGENYAAQRTTILNLIANNNLKPDRYFLFDSGINACRLFFTQWSCALDAVVCFWESRLSDKHDLIPHVIANVVVPSDVDELNSRLKPLFCQKIRGLISGDLVKKCEEKLGRIRSELDSISWSMMKLQTVMIFENNKNYKERLMNEEHLLMNKIREFKLGMNCIIKHIEGEGKILEVKESDKVAVLRFEDRCNWLKIYHVMMRECRRLDEGLPIYAFRQEVIQHISSQQTMVLIGETGSGKSTQLLQFLADSGIVADGALVCTQPRKIAAISLAKRVSEESYGCYGNNVISCQPSYSSARQFDGNLVYMTDHCLLQRCMNDRNLRGISCIIVDEAHERSLNTDLLLAMLKNLLLSRPDLRLIIMSATADAKQLSEYFFGCNMFTVVGRTFPVDVRYVPCLSEGSSQPVMLSTGFVAPYVREVLRVVTDIHKTEQEGTILAFLSSPVEVEWACERFIAPNAEPLALHGKLSFEEQSRVFRDYPGKRKVIFATNVAETSLTIPGVKYVVDSGLAKESRFESGSGMNVLRVRQISKSSANQRAGRAGRTGPGRCYRLYSEDEFDLMTPQQVPEIRRVHLGVAVLKILALGIKNVKDFDFIDAPNPEAIDMAIRNLTQLGAVVLQRGDIELTCDGRRLVRLGIEPRLGKLILGSFHEHLGREGLALAAVMANSSSIFCRVGNHADKLKSDCLRVPFCHRDGDIFTLLSVYKSWEDVPREKRNKWCWDNSINAKSMRRCHDTIVELENCLKTELRMIVPSYWLWKPEVTTQYDKCIKKVLLASLAENVAMYSGSDKLGYRVALTGQHVQLHPACSLLMFNQRPDWVVFGEMLSISNQYLVCVTAFDRDFLSILNPPPLFNASEMENQKLQVVKLSGFGKTLLKKLCGKYNNGLSCLLSRIRQICQDERIDIEVDVDVNEIRIFFSPHNREEVLDFVKNAVDCERRWLQSECLEKCLYHGGPGLSPPVALLGSGAEIKHLEIDKRCLTVDIFVSHVSSIDDKELILFFEKNAPGICAVHRFTAHNKENEEGEKWGSITFLTPDAAERAVELSGVEFNGSVLKVSLSGVTFGVDRGFSFPAVKAKVSWPRRLSRGFAIVICDVRDVQSLISDFSNLMIGERYVRCEASIKSTNAVVVSGIDKEASEPEILNALTSATHCRIQDFFLIRGGAVDNPPCHACEEALVREISVFMPKGSPQINHCRVQVFPPEPKDNYMRALITFDGRLHLEAAKALEQIEGTVLPGFQSWQKIQCQRLFHTSVSCLSSIYTVIKKELDSLIVRLKRHRGIECIFSNTNGYCRVKISATATKTVAEMRKPLEELMRGKIISHASLTPAVLQSLSSREGISLLNSLQREMGIYLLFDRQHLCVRAFGPSFKVVVAEERLINGLLNLHENKQMEIRLRGCALPYDLMKEVVKKFGPNLDGLKAEVPEAELTLNTRRHVISISGTSSAKQKIEEIVNEIARSSSYSTEGIDDKTTCPICLCEVEDAYQLENCLHVFCRSCLVDQCESAIRNFDSLPICCAHEGCKLPFWLVDLRTLLSPQKLEELLSASLVSFVASHAGTYRFCPSPDCRSVYRVADPDGSGGAFVCEACYAETCTSCHSEYHPYLSCEEYKDPDCTLKQWCRQKGEVVKECPVCRITIEKDDGCNHVECICGSHICWVCLKYFVDSDECYTHLRNIHQSIN